MEPGKMISSTSKWVSRLLAVCGFGLFAWMLWYSSANASSYFESGRTAVVLLTGGAAVVLLLLLFAATRYLGRGVFLAAVLSIAIGARLIWIFTVDTQPVSDFLDMHSGALSAASGDFSFGTNDYFTRWGYQIGFALYEAFIITLFGTDPIVLKVFNVLFQAGTAILVYLSTARAFSETGGRAAALLYAVYVPNIMMCSVLTNQHISVFFFFLGVYIIIRRGLAGKWDWLAVGLCFGFAHLMRPLGGFFLVGLVAYIVLFKLLPSIRERKWGALAARTAGAIAVYLLVQQLASFALVQTGVTASPLSNQEPYWKFMIGLNPDTNGGWSYDDTVYVLQFPQGEERNRAELELLKQRLTDKRQIGELFLSKARSMWGAEDSAAMWSIQDQIRPELQKRLIQIERIQYVLLAQFALIAAGVMAYRGASVEASMFMLLLLGYAALHIVIEMQTRYRIDIFPCVFILQSFGATVLLNSFKRWRKTQVKFRPSGLERGL
ncbi:ArnT family glycosyltransferase [Cohnella sp.]|uniref:ArnT family glycosyltransferase n=1 Tax=Cohnella sp. TaxID=1883426 RepID=UPI0037046558